MLLRLSLIIVLFTLSCSHAEIKSPLSREIIASGTPEVETSPTPVVTNRPIRSVDFCNVAFPRFPVYIGDRGKKKYVTLKPGDGCPALLGYGDVTGDGNEEAMMMLGIENRGSAIPEIVYVFTLANGRPRLLWSFETGDRADGGFRNAYADDGQLIVELYGKDRIIGSNLYRGEEGLCCPSSFTRARYEWRGNQFQLLGQPEVLPNDQGAAAPMMRPYDAPGR
jgi:hypothetical protein